MREGLNIVLPKVVPKFYVVLSSESISVILLICMLGSSLHLSLGGVC